MNVAASLVRVNSHRRFPDSLAPIFERNDVFLCPTTTTASLPLHHNPAGPGIEIAGATVDADFGWMLTWPFNMLSALPVINIPSGIAGNGVPIGDHAVFGIAALAEQLSPKIGTFAA